jgi:F-type H+-transporting ATPase subunit b
LDQIFRSVFSTFNVRLEYLAWYLALFLIVLFVLRKYALGPILRMIDARQAEINDSLDRAEKAAQSVEESQKRAEQVIQEAADHAQEIVRRAERAAGDIQEQARQDAKTQAELFLTRARQDIEAERLAAVTDIKARVVDLALFAAAKVLEEKLDADRDRKLVEEAVREAELRGPGAGLQA